MPGPSKADPREPTPGAPGLPEDQFEEMMKQLEEGIKAREQKKKKTSPKKLSVSSALENQKKKGTGVTSGVAALRNEAATRSGLASPKKK